MAEFRRTLNFRTTIAIVIGGVIGSGIFMKPALMASQLGSPLLLLSVWIVAGCITLFGALSNSEVASMFPETGGQYIFFQKMYGETFAFMYGWAAFAVFNTAGNASIAYVCARYADYFLHLPRFDAAIEQSYSFHIPFIGNIFPLANAGIKSLTIFILLALSFINFYSVRYGGALQRFLTALKAVAIIFLIGGILFSGKGNFNNLFHNAAQMPEHGALLGAYIAAIAGAFWAYDGWNNITFVAGEIQHPQRNIPRSLFIGLSFCIVVYALVNLAYIYVMPVENLAASNFVAADAATIAWGAIGGAAIALMVLLSTFGTTNANVLATARVTFAMGQQNRWFKWAGIVQPKYQTPGNAIWLNAIWAIVLVISGSFDMLTDMVIFVSWLFYGMSALGVFVLRRKMPDRERPYKVWGYPIVPAIFVGFTFFFLAATLANDIYLYASGQTVMINSMMGLLLTGLGIPLYWYFNYKNSSK